MGKKVSRTFNNSVSFQTFTNLLRSKTDQPKLENPAQETCFPPADTGATTLGITAINIMTVGIITFCIIKTQRINTNWHFVQNKYNDKTQNFVIRLSVVMFNVVAPSLTLWHPAK
jgi:hypothetical protein